MRNLNLLTSLRARDAQLRNVKYMSIDFDTGHVYLATDAQCLALSPTSQQVLFHTDLMSAGHVTADQPITGLQHLPDQMAAAMTTVGGDLLLWSPEIDQTEVVGTVASGLVAMAWSPDKELVVMATGQHTLIVMTREFEPLTELPIEIPEFGEAANVNVGWGKKETQFHGTAGKQVAVAEAVTNCPPAGEWDDRAVRLSWRGDGEMLCVSYVEKATDSRRIRVYTRDCVLHSTTEVVPGLEQALSWKPSGNLIAASQMRPNKHELVFFEQNGLRHGQFTLPYPVNTVRIREVLWNLDSNVLVTWTEDIPSEEPVSGHQLRSHLDVWSVGNYHWYRKQHLEFTEEQQVSAVCWDPEFPYRLHVSCCDGQYLQYTWTWSTDSAPPNLKEYNSLVAVIDGERVLMTPFQEMVVPPPMCAYYLNLPCPAIQVAFSPHSPRLAVLLSDDRLVVYCLDSSPCLEVDKPSPDSGIEADAAGGGNFAIRCSLPKQEGIYTLSYDLRARYPLGVQHLMWSGPDSLLYTRLNDTSTHSVITAADIGQSSVTSVASCNAPDYIYNVAQCESTVVVQLCKGSLVELDTSASMQLLPFGESGACFPLPCAEMRLSRLGGRMVALGLTERFRFHVNNQEVANNVTSFCVHGDFLILTTHDHTCRCIPTSWSVAEITNMVSTKRLHPCDESIRRVERGSRIVTGVAGDTKLVLQMPRGNIETINPRALVLAQVRRHLDHLEYGSAFSLMRRHRINLNLLADHDLPGLLSNMAVFVDQLESVANINLFLTDLQEEDVTVTMYAGAYSSKSTNSILMNKVDTVCEAVRVELESRGSGTWLLSILTAHLKKTQPELEVALQRIQELKRSPGTVSSVSVETALEYLLFLVDVNELYDVALGTYDFQLVTMVASKSQKDPKEYLPFLNSLRELDEDYRHFTIDKHLKRPRKALDHIAKCSGSERFADCLTLVKEHHIYAHAVRLYQDRPAELTQIAHAYAHYLAGLRHHQEAGVVLTKAGLFIEAAKSFEEALDWRQVMCILRQQKASADTVLATARRLADRLKSRNRHGDAAVLLSTYCGDVEEAIVTLIEGRLWIEALRLMHDNNRLDFIQTDLESALLETCDNMVASLDASRDQFGRQCARLMAVRAEKERARLDLLRADADERGGDADLYSETTSVTGDSVVSDTSRMSRFTTASQRSTGRSTGKSQRKAERRKWSLKEGSQNEDLALIETLHKAGTQAEASKAEVTSLLIVLVQQGHEAPARQLQASLTSLLADVLSRLGNVWDDTSGEFKELSRIPKTDGYLLVPPVVSMESSWQLHMLRPDD